MVRNNGGIDMKEFIYLYLNDAMTFLFINIFCIGFILLAILAYVGYKEEKKNKL